MYTEQPLCSGRLGTLIGKGWSLESNQYFQIGSTHCVKLVQRAYLPWSVFLGTSSDIASAIVWHAARGIKRRNDGAGTTYAFKKGAPLTPSNTPSPRALANSHKASRIVNLISARRVDDSVLGIVCQVVRRKERRECRRRMARGVSVFLDRSIVKSAIVERLRVCRKGRQNGRRFERFLQHSIPFDCGCQECE